MNTIKQLIHEIRVEKIEKCNARRDIADSDGSSTVYCDIGKGGYIGDMCHQKDYCFYSFLPKWIINIYSYFYGRKLDKEYREAEERGDI